jgi:hypothetical protein
VAVIEALMQREADGVKARSVEASSTDGQELPAETESEHKSNGHSMKHVK